jgi:asparagine synthase (glutamine-hydrolysing)
MRGALQHRGPDDVGLFSDNGIALGHTRLSIIDIETGHQPLSNEDETIHLVINGEIYNYKSLQQDLISRGHRLRTQSDCEVIVHLYEEEGENCVDKLDGMFAFALWDSKNEKLFLARDRFGIKPLYVSISEGQVCFASELTSIVKSRLVKKEIDPQALYAFLAFSYVPGPLSILKGVRKVRPAEMLIIKEGAVRSNVYWKPKHLKIPPKRSQAAEELKGMFEESVSSHLISDVPVAAFLSGGVDSSGVVALAQKQQNMKTFCVSFPDSSIDEAPVARRVASHLGTDHHEVTINIDPISLISEVVNYMDEPFADSSALPTFALCREARKICKVVLSGDGGDEVFGGYTGRYRVAALKACLPVPGAIANGIRKVPPWRSGRRRSFPEMLELATLSEEERYLSERQITLSSDRAELFGQNHALEYEENLKAIATQPIEGFPHRHPVHRALWMDLKTSLADDMLVKVDRMSMAHGLEVRVPLLDHRLVEFALSLPAKWLVSPFPVEGKRLLRRVVTPLLPEGILNRSKQGFVVPLNEWLKNHYLSMFDTMCLGSSSSLAKYLDQNSIIKIRNRAIGTIPREDLYSLLILELWLQRLEVA